MDVLKQRVYNLFAGQSVVDSWGRENLVGYEPITLFWADFTIADAIGVDAVEDTFNRAFAEWKSDYKYLTELVLVLNHKMWEHQDENEDLGDLYYSLWFEADSYASDNLKDDELAYYLRGLGLD